MCILPGNEELQPPQEEQEEHNEGTKQEEHNEETDPRLVLSTMLEMFVSFFTVCLHSLKNSIHKKLYFSC